MSNSEKITLKVTMMGGFSCKAGGKVPDFTVPTSSKLAQLFMIILYNYPSPVPLSNVIDALYSDSDVDTNNSFKALLFRLRNTMSEEFGISQSECVILRGGMLRLSDHFEVESDVLDFNTEYERAAMALSEDEQLPILENIFRLYRGEFLPCVSVLPWVIFENACIEDKYIKAVNRLCECYSNIRDFQGAYDCFKRALVYFPFREEWMIGAIEALVSMGKSKQAMAEYEDFTGLIFDEMGLYPSERLLDVMRKISDEISESVNVSGDISDALNEGEVYGAYYCSFPNFANSYHVLERIMKRENVTSAMMLITVTDSKGAPLEKTDEIVAAATLLRIAISKTLRRNDMYTKYSKTQMLVLLWRSSKDNVPLVINRLKKCIAEESEGCDVCNISYSIIDGGDTPKPLAGQQDTFGSVPKAR